MCGCGGLKAMTPKPVITEDVNDDPPAQDDELGIPEPDPFTPDEVEETDVADGRTPEEI